MQILDLAKQLVNLGLPFLGKIVAGSAGETVAKTILNTIGISDDQPDDAIAQALNDPKNLDKLIELQKLMIEHEKNVLDDVANARQRQVELAKAGIHDYVPEILALSFIVIYAVVQLYVLYHPGGQDDMISARVQDIVMIIVGFYFGNAYRKGGQYLGQQGSK